MGRRRSLNRKTNRKRVELACEIHILIFLELLSSLLN